MTKFDLAYYGMQSLESHTDHLNSLCIPAPNASISYDLLAGALIWSDETNDKTPIKVIHALRQLRHYRTHVMLTNESPNPAVWEHCKKLFPNWVGFRPERYTATPELLEFYRREEINSRWCLRKLERDMELKSHNG
jgi:hypothetical protein